MRFAIFPVHLSKVLRLPRKSDARSYEVLPAPVTQNHLSKPTDLMLQNATPLRKSAPWPPNISDEHVFCTAPATRHASLQILFQWPTPAIVFGNATKPSRFAHFEKVHNPLRLPRPKVARTCGVFNILTSTCASRHNGVLFFDISTSKSGPRMVCFVHFDFEMCFAPQRRALFRHLNFQKCSEREVFLAFSLANVLRATTACTFSSLTWPDGSAPAALASLLLGPGTTNHWKNTVFRDFPTFSRICVFFLLTLSLLWSSLFYFSHLSDSSHPCVSSVHIVGSLTSKLPSMIICVHITNSIWNIYCKNSMTRTTLRCQNHDFCNFHFQSGTLVSA